ncbi:nucleosome assembly protein [Novymonas esmeraldas]|uniref:Nucleosome assembly protein n=1 Tax=Novymonas esmeraldas TaxID=1808958 RepID=A0AAW0ER49_9TRYP
MPPKQQQRAAPVVQPEEDEEDDVMEMGDMMDLQRYLDPDFSKNFMASLPEKIRQRALVLVDYDKDLLAQQKAHQQKEADIIKRYDALFAPLLQRRREIVTGAAVTEEEVSKGVPEDHAGQVSIAVAADAAEAEDSFGLEGFWLRALSHHTVIESTIEPHDEDVLKHLIDIRSSAADGDYGSFQVTFTFAPNDFFAEETLTATVTVKDDESALTVTPITWKAGKNVTMRTITKKQRAKRTGQVRTISHDEPQPSFFWLFVKRDGAAAEADDDDEEAQDFDDDEQRISTLEVLHTRIVPNAVRYYTGEAPNGFSDQDEEDEEDEEEEEEEEEEEILPRGRGGNRGGNRGGRGGRGF